MTASSKALICAGVALAALAAAAGAQAALSQGDMAPDFTAPAFLGGAPFTFKLADALKKGPVVVYFFPAAYTKGCQIEAHLFADAADDFKKDGATVIGVTAGNTDKLQEFSKDTLYCSGKFAMAADTDLKIATSYKATLALKPGWSDRTSYVIAPSGKIVLDYSDLKPDDHVAKTLAAVQQLHDAH
ncbi:MAG TPA: peroxiredoxin [Caulobacteraceae bacterium]|nr:peroxiredoxin [Caulobacteraceae bacterium]